MRCALESNLEIVGSVTEENGKLLDHMRNRRLKLIGVSGLSPEGENAVALTILRRVEYAEIISLNELARRQLVSMGIEDDAAMQSAIVSYRQKTFGSAYWIDLALSNALSISSTKILIISGIHTTDEAQLVQRIGGALVWVEKAGSNSSNIENFENKSGNRAIDRKTQYNLSGRGENEHLTVDRTNELNSVKHLAEYVMYDDGKDDFSRRALVDLLGSFDRTPDHRDGNLKFISISKEVAYNEVKPWIEDIHSLVGLEKSYFFEDFLGGSRDDILGDGASGLANVPLSKIANILDKPNLRSITGNQVGKRIAKIFEEENPKVAIAALRSFKPSNPEEEYFSNLRDDEFFDMHLHVQLLWRKAKNNVEEELLQRMDHIRETDRFQFERKNDRGLDKMRSDGVVFSLLSEHFGRITELAKSPILAERPILEVIKNERIFQLSGFTGSKASLVVHDVVDHMWTTDILDKMGLFRKFSEMFSAIGHPERIDIFKREGETIASISYGVRAFAGIYPGFKPLVRVGDIIGMIRDRSGEFCDRHTNALRIINNLEHEGVEWRSLGYVYSNYLTELDEQRRSYGCIKFRDPGTHRVSGELDPMSVDYLCFFIEAHHILLKSSSKHRNALFYTHFIMEEYLRNINHEKAPMRPIAITPALLDGTKLKYSDSVPKAVSEWMFRNYSFTANRNLV